MEAEYGMQGRLRPIQLTPFECQTCYGGTVSGRHNLDLQDMRRVVDPCHWLDPEDHLPHVGPITTLGYMRLYEWTGSSYDIRADTPSHPVSWISRRLEADEFRMAWRQAFRVKFGSAVDDSCSDPVEAQALAQAIRVSVNEAFCDGVNTGFYVNNYTTKPGPGLANMLEELQRGIERLEDERREREDARRKEEEAAKEAGEHVPGRRGTMFAETMRTLTRLTSSYRRCHWKSAAEIIFPLLFQHLTFASHRTWKLYVKKAVFFCVEAWRRRYGESILNQVVDRGDAAEPVIFKRPDLDDLTLKGWRKVARTNPATGVTDELFIGPQGQACADISSAFDLYQSEQQAHYKPQKQLTLVQELLKLNAVTERVATSNCDENVSSNLQALQATGEDAAVQTTSITDAKHLAVTTSSLEDYLFRGDHPLLADLSWAAYGTWVYRIELPPRPEQSVRSSVARHVDICFDPSYKLHRSHAQRISSEPRVPMFEGFTMPPVTHDPERNAMYKQIQCRPVAIHADSSLEQTMEELVLNAFASFSQPQKPSRFRDLSAQAATAFNQAYLEWFNVMEEEAQHARYLFGERFEYPSLWETQEMQDELTEKLRVVTAGDIPEVASPDFDAQKPRCTARMYSSLLAQQRIANLEGLARARQSKQKRRRDEDAWLHEEYVKVNATGGTDPDDPDAENDEEVEAVMQQTLCPSEVFQPIRLKTSLEEQKKLLNFELQGRQNQYTKDFLKQAWLRSDIFESVQQHRSTETDVHEPLLARLSQLTQARLGDVSLALFYPEFNHHVSFPGTSVCESKSVFVS